MIAGLSPPTRTGVSVERAGKTCVFVQNFSISRALLTSPVSAGGRGLVQLSARERVLRNSAFGGSFDGLRLELESILIHRCFGRWCGL